MHKPDWRRLFHLPKRRQVPTVESSAASHPPSSTKQETPISVVEPILPLPTATADEVSVSSPEPALSVTPTTSVLLPSMGQDTPTPVPELTSTPITPPTTITTDREDPVPAQDPEAGSAPPPLPVKSTTSSSIEKTVGNGLIVGLKLLKEAVAGVGVPGLEATVSGVVGVIDLIKDVKDNADALSDLDARISDLAHAMSSSPDFHRGLKVDGLLRSKIDAFLLELHRMLMEVQRMLGDTNFVVRTANSQIHKDAIDDINSKMDRLQSRFSTEGILSLELEMSGARHDIQMLAQSQQAQENEARINAIPRAHARYDDTSTKPSQPCHPDTRIDLLQSIRRWIYGGCDTTPYFWLCGEVGVGKTSVAHTVAQENEALQQLGACFFFSRHDESRRTPSLLFTSIAYQLARFDHGFYKALADILKPNPDIVKRTPMEQFKKLILEPLIQSGIDPSRTIVIVIDGLDECSDPALILEVLTLGFGEVSARLRVLISSRPYATILTKFKDPRLYHFTSETQFRDINPDTLSNDVAAYLAWSLAVLAAKSSLPSPWPRKEYLHELIKRAAGLMIVASTYIKYIDDPEAGNPVGQLARIISRTRGMGSSPLAELDALYDQILNDLKMKLTSDPQVLNARDIIAFVILAPKGINVSALAGLFYVDPFDVRLVLRRLTAVILLLEDDGGNIAPFHASFGEYIQDSTRCTVQEFSVDAPAAYGRIVTRCFDVMTSASNSGITGVEYSCARGQFWLPKHLHRIARNLGYYLPRSSHAHVEEVKAASIGTGMWTFLNLALNLGWALDSMIPEMVQPVFGFELFPLMEGVSSGDSSNVSLARLMIANHLPPKSWSKINRMRENPATSEAITAEGLEPSPRQALKFAIGGSCAVKADVTLRIAQSIRCWTKYTHCNVMSFCGVDVKIDEENVPAEVLVFVASPVSLQHTSSLHEHLKRNNNPDMISRVRMALGIADGLHYLHGSLPPQPYNGVNPHQIMVSGQGQPFLYPTKWVLDFQSRPSPQENGDIDYIHCLHDLVFPLHQWFHWNLIGTGLEWQYSPEPRLQVDVWDFGALLYQMITGEEPPAMYSRLADSNEASSYEPPAGRYIRYHDTWSYDYWDIPRYEAAVPLLLNALEASEDLKALVKSCWTIRRQDRPLMSEVFERLKAIVEAMEP